VHRTFFALTILLATARAEPPQALQCLYGSTHSHCWFPTGGDDGGIRTEVDRKQLAGVSYGDPFRRFRRENAALFKGGTAADAFRYARERAQLDFLAITVHNHMTLPAEYAQLHRAAATINREHGATFCALVGQEWSTISRGNHVTLLGAGSVCDVPKGRFDELYERWLPAHPETALAILNHPTYKRGKRWMFGNKLEPLEYGLDDYRGDARALAAAARPYVRLIEVVSGPAHGRLQNFKRWRGRPQGYFRYLNRGFRVGPTVGTDNHYQNWGTSSPARTGVWAHGRSPQFLLEALHARRTFATEDRNMRVWMRVAGAAMGSEVVTDAESVSVEITLHDGDEPDALWQVRLLTDSDGFLGRQALVVHEIAKASAGTHRVLVRLPAGNTYVLAHVVQRHDEDAAWTAPVWIDRRGRGK